MQTRAASTMLFANQFAIVVLAATAATAASSVFAGPPDLPISPPTPRLNVISPPVAAAATTMIGNSASTPTPPKPTLPIGMRRMYDHEYAHPSVPPTLPSASPPVSLPESEPELTNSERLAQGLPIRAPRLRRVLAGTPLEDCKSPPLLL